MAITVNQELFDSSSVKMEILPEFSINEYRQLNNSGIQPFLFENG
jgi:hypothetical protein